MTKFSNQITWGFKWYSDFESSDPTYQFTLLAPTNDDVEAYAQARELIPVPSNVHVNVDMGDAGTYKQADYRDVK